MALGQINKGIVAFLAILAIAAASFLWYSKMYQPAVEARAMAQTTLDTAVQDQQKARAELQAASDNLRAESKKAVAPKDAVAKTAIARTAIPPDGNIGDASVVIEELADKSGVQIELDLTTSEAAQQQVAEGTTGAKPLDIEIVGAGSYAQMVAFMDLVESTVYDKGGKAFVNGRLFNVVKFQVAPPEETSGSGDLGSGNDFGGFGSQDGAEEPSSGSGLTFKRGDVSFTLIVRMYTSEANKAGEIGANTPDTASQGTGADTSPDAAGQSATPGDAAGPGTAGGQEPVGASAAGTQPAPNSATPSLEGA